MSPEDGTGGWGVHPRILVRDGDLPQYTARERKKKDTDTYREKGECF